MYASEEAPIVGACLLCGETMREGQEVAEVIEQVPVGDDYDERRGLAHAQCYLDHAANDEAVFLA